MEKGLLYAVGTAVDLLPLLWASIGEGHVDIDLPYKDRLANGVALDRWLTHGSWSLLWPAQLLILRIKNWHKPWRAFWRRHVYLVRSTGQMVMSGDPHLLSKESHQSPVPYILKKTALVTTALTVAGGSWYLAVGWTTGSDLTAIYNCSTFFAYAFSIPLLGDKLRLDKVTSVAVAFAGVLIIAYGDSKAAGEGKSADEAENRTAGNIVIGIGSVLYGLYEVLYKKLACPPDGVSSGRGVIFANTFGSCIGLFTLLVLWIPLPILHVTGLERFEMPTGPQSWLLAISTLSNAGACRLFALKAVDAEPNSVFWMFFGAYLSDVPCPVLCRRPVSLVKV